MGGLKVFGHLVCCRPGSIVPAGLVDVGQKQVQQQRELVLLSIQAWRTVRRWREEGGVMYLETVTQLRVISGSSVIDVIIIQDPLTVMKIRSSDVCADQSLDLQSLHSHVTWTC